MLSAEAAAAAALIKIRIGWLNSRAQRAPVGAGLQSEEPEHRPRHRRRRHQLTGGRSTEAQLCSHHLDAGDVWAGSQRRQPTRLVDTTEH
jgi:hypothetical protein